MATNDEYRKKTFTGQATFGDPKTIAQDWSSVYIRNSATSTANATIRFYHDTGKTIYNDATLEPGEVYNDTSGGGLSFAILITPASGCTVDYRYQL